MLNNTEDFAGKWDLSTVPDNVVVGKDCYIERRDCFDRVRTKRIPAITIGDRVEVYTWTAFSIEGDGTIEIGEDSVLVGALFMCGERIKVGKRVVISYNATIADSDFHPKDPELRKLDAKANAPGGDLSLRPPYKTSPVTIEDDVVVGIGAMILKGVRVGRGASIKAGAVVTSDVPDGATVGGNPARILDNTRV
jgi:acetyltransferase-like isoleucine patch superfamily enzyme